MKPKLKNHKVFGDAPISFYELAQRIYNSNSRKYIELVYFVPAGRVISTKFFAGKLWQAALFSHAQKGHFWPVKKYDNIMRDRIKSALSQAKTSAA